MDMTEQDRKWAAEIGQEYTDRNTLTAEKLDALYLECFGVTRQALNMRFLGDLPRDISILEVGCNIGMQLRHLQMMGFTNLHGIELQQYAIDRLCVQDVEVRQGSAYELPYADGEFDLVYTSGVLIHLPPASWNPHAALQEIVRVSRKWVWGFEYFAFPRQEIKDRNWQNMLWADDYPAHFLWWTDNSLHLVRRWSEAYRKHLLGTVADMYLLEKACK